MSNPQSQDQGMDPKPARKQRTVWLRCRRCYSEITRHERTQAGGYYCTKCGCERELRTGGRNG